MEQIFPKKRKLTPIEFYDAVVQNKVHKEEIVVLVPTTPEGDMYKKRTLEDLIEGCMFFVEE